MPNTLHLTIQENEPLPSAGETHLFRGLAGRYAVTIHRVRSVEPLADHSRRVTVTATRRLIPLTGSTLPVTGMQERLSMSTPDAHRQGGANPKRDALAQGRM